MSLEKFNYKIIKLESTSSAPENILNAAKKCRDSIKILEDVWFSRNDCKSVNIVMELSIKCFDLMQRLESNLEIKNTMNGLAKLKIDNVRIPKNSNKDTIAKIIDAKTTFKHNFNIIQTFSIKNALL